MKSNCLYCNKEHEFFRSQSTGKYCSNKCQRMYQTREAIESGKATTQVAKTYLKERVEYKCNICNIANWQDKPLTLQIDHIDGNNKNNTQTNIRWLCPNCHSQTLNWGSKNTSTEGKQRQLQASKIGSRLRKTYYGKTISCTRSSVGRATLS